MSFRDLTVIRDVQLACMVGEYRVHYDGADGLLVGYRWDKQLVAGLFHNPTAVIWIPMEWVDIVDPADGRVIA